MLIVVVVQAALLGISAALAIVFFSLWRTEKITAGYWEGVSRIALLEQEKMRRRLMEQ